MDAEQNAELDAVIDHDAAFGQGPGVRDRLPARLGGRPVPAPARARRGRPLRPRGRAPPRLCRPDARQEAPAHLVRLQPPHPRPVAVDHPVALPRRTARGPCRGGRRRQFLWRLRRLRSRRRSGRGGRQNPYGASRFDDVGADAARRRRFSNTYATPGWQRAQANRTEATDRNWGTRSGHQVERIGYGETDSGFGAGRSSVKARTIDGELVAKSVSNEPSPFSVGDRVFHQKFGNGNVVGDRRQQADDRLRQGRPEARAGRVRDRRLSPQRA